MIELPWASKRVPMPLEISWTTPSEAATTTPWSDYGTVIVATLVGDIASTCHSSHNIAHHMAIMTKRGPPRLDRLLSLPIHEGEVLTASQTSNFLSSQSDVCQYSSSFKPPSSHVLQKGQTEPYAGSHARVARREFQNW
jgi:hypothetical protein